MLTDRFVCTTSVSFASRISFLFFFISLLLLFLLLSAVVLFCFVVFVSLFFLLQLIFCFVFEFGSYYAKAASTFYLYIIVCNAARTSQNSQKLFGSWNWELGTWNNNDRENQRKKKRKERTYERKTKKTKKLWWKTILLNAVVVTVAVEKAPNTLTQWAKYEIVHLFRKCISFGTVLTTNMNWLCSYLLHALFMLPGVRFFSSPSLRHFLSLSHWYSCWWLGWLGCCVIR